MARVGIVAAVGALSVLAGLGAVMFLKNKNAPVPTYTVEVIIQNAQGYGIACPFYFGSYPGITNSTGIGYVSNVPQGTYNLAINAAGYKLFQETAILNAFQTTFAVSLTSSTCPTPCLCNQTQDALTCVCTDKTPGQFRMLATQPISNAGSWVAEYMCQNLGGGGCYNWGLGESQNMTTTGQFDVCSPTAPAYIIEPNPTTQNIFLAGGTLLDDHGNGICNTTLRVTLTNSLANIPWKSGDGNFKGTISLSIPSTVTTDINGNFTIQASSVISLDTINSNGSAGCGFILPGTSNLTTAEVSIPFTMQFAIVSDPSFPSGLTICEVRAQVCCYYNSQFNPICH